MNLSNITEIRAAKTNDLVAFYNAHVAPDMAVKKFRDRTTAETKAAAILEARAGEEKVKAVARSLDWITTPEAVEAAIQRVNPEAVSEQIEAGAWPWPKAADQKAAPAPARKATKGAAEKAGNSDGVAASWSVASTRIARLTRHGCSVTYKGQTQTFRSVREAFRKFRLPDEKHIKFRGQLKISGKEGFTNNGHVYLFNLVAFEEPSDAIRI